MIGYGNSMFLATHGILARSASGGGVDPDAQAFITAASITDPTQQSAINQLVVDLKGYGVWSKMKAVYPFVGGTASTHKWNLKDPRDLDAAFRLVFSGGWTHSSTGATPNGTNAYADSKFIPATNLTINSAHFSTYKRTNNLSANLQIDGVYNNTTNKAFQLLYSPSPANAIIGDVSATTYTSTNTSGMVVASRTASNLLKVFKNNSNIATGTNTITNLPTIYSVMIGARTDAGFISYYNNLECAFASLGDGLTDTEATNFYIAVQAFNTALARQV